MRFRFRAADVLSKAASLTAWPAAPTTRRVLMIALAAPIAPVPVVIGAAALLPGGIAARQTLLGVCIIAGLASAICAVALLYYLLERAGARRPNSQIERMLAALLDESDGRPRAAQIGRAPAATPHKVFRKAQKDALTGLCNRLGFGAAVPVRGVGALIYARIDGFPGLVDSLGTAGANRLLRHAAQVLLRPLTHDDTLARLSGETFAAWLPGSTEEQAWQIAARLRAAVNDRVLVRGRGVGLSVGLAVSDGVADRDTLLTRAGAALDLARAGGHGVVQAVDGDASFLFEQERLRRTG
ncbi:hypothetical protein AL036_11815 [Salipiger aestuarii]|uniref:Diguanylate cyclase (GGDEF)-like protein n=1 Tax=Salipiger aestuarii TaxID=568098 RepID=A0A327Y908_9RHOB|nr:GGDEF domain-containing protein [Salipiger aestuarii]KAA8607146.1 hypothetical protein AL036_11815 [Salipiger aestuarii]KAA8611034.1 hypothetical protein AL037_10910 [Salipiger aestuarii]KAB2542268.1 hypothetical protein AL035_07855 [Salipiger aestuarii]RAK16967.1 diguanylate cyclase (GGDEF)-like protein [Salipiger aestuarii]